MTASVTSDIYTRRFNMTMSDGSMSGIMDGDLIARAAYVAPRGELWDRLAWVAPNFSLSNAEATRIMALPLASRTAQECKDLRRWFEVEAEFDGDDD